MDVKRWIWGLKSLTLNVFSFDCFEGNQENSPAFDQR